MLKAPNTIALVLEELVLGTEVPGTIWHGGLHLPLEATLGMIL